MATDTNREIVRRFIEEVFNRGNLSVAEELLSPDYVHHDPATAEMGSGVEGLEKMVQFYREAFPDYTITLDDQMTSEDRVIERWTGRGTHRGTLMGIPPTNRTVEASGISIHRLQNGKIAETWTVFDTAGVLRQLGVVPGSQGT